MACGLGGWGAIIAMIGIFTGWAGFAKKTTFSGYEGAETYNMGLIAEQNQLILSGAVMIIIGVIMIVAMLIINAISAEQAKLAASMKALENSNDTVVSAEQKAAIMKIANEPSPEYLG